MADDGERSHATDNPKATTETSGLVFRALAGFGAFLCLVLAVVGFFLPLLPCTPFLLLASFLLVRCSPNMHRRLRQSKYFGRILTDWEERGGIRPRDKSRAVLIIVACVVLTLTFGNLTTGLRIAVVILVTIGLCVILRLPTANDPQ